MYVLWPVFTYPGGFHIGTEEDEGFHSPNISRGDAYWSLLCGFIL